jgi:hypothetical protein
MGTKITILEISWNTGYFLLYSCLLKEWHDNMRVGEPQSRSGFCGEEKISCTCFKSNPIFQPASPQPVAISTKLSRLSFRVKNKIVFLGTFMVTQMVKKSSTSVEPQSSPSRYYSTICRRRWTLSIPSQCVSNSMKQSTYWDTTSRSDSLQFSPSFTGPKCSLTCSKEPITVPLLGQMNTSRFWKVLTMVCNTRDYWVFGLCPSSGILKNTTFRELVQWLRSALSKGPNRVGVSHPSPEGENRSSFRNVVFFKIPDDLRTPKTQ